MNFCIRGDHQKMVGKEKQLLKISVYPTPRKSYRLACRVPWRRPVASTSDQRPAVAPLRGKEQHLIKEAHNKIHQRYHKPVITTPKSPSAVVFPIFILYSLNLKQCGFAARTGMVLIGNLWYSNPSHATVCSLPTKKNLFKFYYFDKKRKIWQRCWPFLGKCPARGRPGVAGGRWAWMSGGPGAAQWWSPVGRSRSAWRCCPDCCSGTERHTPAQLKDWFKVQKKKHLIPIKQSRP